MWDCKISKLLRHEDAVVNDALARWLSELDDWNSVARYLQWKMARCFQSIMWQDTLD